MSSVSVTSKKSKKMNVFKVSYLLVFLLVVVLVVGGIFGYKEYNKLRDENKRLSNPQESARVETDKIKSEVSNIIEVPTDEEPTIATVSDASKLSNQAFFAKAQNGDKLLMYSKSKKAILYRPTSKKIIEVAPINLGDNTDKTTSSTTQSTSTDTPATSTDIVQQPGIAQ